MDDLELFDLYNKTSDKKKENFKNKVNSTLHITSNYNKVECNYEWLDIMEDTIHYIDNILRNPNRFIVNEEDVVKIELARRITVESIKHLSKNTNLIQDFDPKTGDVRHSKILNINKEESYNTYENRFIYSLIQNMKFYITRKKRNLVASSSLKDNKTFDYQASSKLGSEHINLQVMLDSKKEEKKENKNDEGLDVFKRIEKLELQISDLTQAQVYQDINKLHIALVTSPIKKTNVILKNVNFQYAVKLWNYMQENMEDDVKKTHESKDYYDTDTLKKYMDESFLLNYLVIDTLNNEESTFDKKEITEKLVSNMVSKIMDISGGSLNEDELKDIVSKQYSVIKYKTVVNDKEIYKIFKDNMDEYLNTLKSIKF